MEKKLIKVDKKEQPFRNLISKLYNTKTVIIVLVLSFILISVYNPLANTFLNIGKYNRQVGIGIVNGIDISVVINNFYKLYIVIFPLTFFVLSFTINWILEKRTQLKRSKVIIFLNSLAVILSIYVAEFYQTKYFFYESIFKSKKILLGTSIFFLVFALEILIRIVNGLGRKKKIIVNVESKVNNINKNKFKFKDFLRKTCMYFKNTFILNIGFASLAFPIVLKIGNLQKFSFGYLDYLAIFCAIFVLSAILITGIFRRKLNSEEFDYIRKVSIFAPLIICISVFGSNLKLESVLYRFDYLILLALNFVILLFSIFKQFLKIEFRVVKWQFLINLISTFIVMIIFNDIVIQHSPAVAFFAILIILNLLTVVFLNFLSLRKILSDTTFNRLQKSMIPFMLSGIMISLMVEFSYILNQYNIYLKDIKWWICGISLCSYIISIFIYVLLIKKRSDEIVFDFEKYYYPILLISYAMISVALPLQSILNSSYFKIFDSWWAVSTLFENSNHALAISDFLNNGSIPIIQNFDAHMTSNSIWGIIYGIINKDYFGALYIPYFEYTYVFICLLLYKILDYVFEDKNFAFFTTLFFPTIMAYEFASIGFVAILAIMYVAKKNSLFSHLIYVISLVFLCVYKLDIAFSYILASYLTLILLKINNPSKISIKKHLISLAIISILPLSGYLYVCLKNNIDILVRIKEFLGIVSSNLNWAYGDIGDVTKANFTYVYLFIPLAVVFALITAIVRFLKLKDNLNNKGLIVLTILCIVFLVNIPRGLVRHNLVETDVNVIGISLLILAVATSVFIFKKNKNIFILTFTSLVIFSNIMAQRGLVKFETLSNMSLNKFTKLEFLNKIPENKVERIVMPEENRTKYNEIAKFITDIIPEDETYIDFTNQSMLYILSNRKKPVYINQSPSMLSTEYTQYQFIDQIEKNSNVKFALMPKKRFEALNFETDSILNSYRYYLVAEYIYKNYRPLAEYDEFQIWCKKLDFEVNLTKYKELDNLKYSLIEKYNIDFDYMHYYYLNYLPYVYANFDEKKCVNNKAFEGAVTFRSNNNDYEIDNKVVSKDNGNFLMVELNDDKTNEYEMFLGKYIDNNFEKLVTFKFKTVAGKNKYIFRISSDYYWYSNDLDNIVLTKIVNKENIKCNALDVQVLSGE